MALRTFVKVGQINNLSDARYCAGMGVALLGFNLEPGTVHYIDPEKFRELSEWVAGVSFAAEFTQATPETIKRLLPEYPVEYLQTDRAEYLQELQQLDIPLILRLHISSTTDLHQLEQQLEANADKVAFFLLEADGEKKISEELSGAILQLGEDYPLVCGFGIAADSVNSLLDRYTIIGIALQGGEEIRAGFNTFDAIADILESLEVDEAY